MHCTSATPSSSHEHSAATPQRSRYLCKWSAEELAAKDHIFGMQFAGSNKQRFKPGSVLINNVAASSGRALLLDCDERKPWNSTDLI
jgi:hypothetical protein